MTIFSHATGAVVRYEEGVLYISDLNPEAHTRWRMSRYEMFKFGLRSIMASLARSAAK